MISFFDFSKRQVRVLGREGTVAMAKDFYGDEIPPGGHEISKLWLAMKALDRREFDECLGYCNAVLEKNPYDQQAWVLKARSISHWSPYDRVGVVNADP